MNWKFINDGNAQIDNVGNIVQIGGGVVPKACQKCKVEFKSKSKPIPITQDAPFFKCKDCGFESNLGDSAFTHTLDSPDHKIERKTKSRIVGYNNTLEGILSYVTKNENDVIILCGDCNDIKC